MATGLAYPSRAATVLAIPGVRTFLVVWVGQFVSAFGSGLTRFGLGVWVYEQTGSASQFALILFFGVLPGILVSSFAGAVVDRSDRKRAMLLSDATAALGILSLGLLLHLDRLAPWHIYAVVALNSAAGAFQGPAHSATTALLIPREHLARASGVVQFGQATVQIASPLLAAALLGVIGFTGLLLIDVATFLFAASVLAVVDIPSPGASSAPGQRHRLWRDVLDGWRYMWARSGLVGLVAVFAVLNFGIGISQALYQPLVLSFASREALGVISSCGGLGMLVGSLFLTAWGGPKRRIHGVLGGVLVVGLAHVLLGVRPSVPLLCVALFGILFSAPLVNGSNAAILMAKVAPEVQGRVFATLTMIAWSTLPLAYLAAGPLADHVFEPMLAAGGSLAGSIGALTGVGPGRGMGLMLALTGVLLLGTGIVGYIVPCVAKIEEQIPDAAPNR